MLDADAPAYWDCYKGRLSVITQIRRPTLSNMGPCHSPADLFLGVGLLRQIGDSVATNRWGRQIGTIARYGRGHGGYAPGKDAVVESDGLVGMFAVLDSSGCDNVEGIGGIVISNAQCGRRC